MVEPFRATEQLVTALDAESALTRAAVAASASGGRDRGVDDAGMRQFEFGSRAGFRTWGVWGPNAWRRMPFVLAISSESTAEGARVTCSMSSNEGWYAVRLPVADREFARAFTRRVSAIEEALAS